MSFEGSYVWKVRQKLSHDLLLCPAATVIVERHDGAILLIRRLNGRWALVGGIANEGESFTDTATRELHEETGIVAQAADLIPFGSISDPELTTLQYDNGDKVQIFGLGFVLQHDAIPEAAHTDTSEVDQSQFFAPEALPKDMHPATYAEIDLYKRYRVTNQFQTG